MKNAWNLLLIMTIAALLAAGCSNTQTIPEEPRDPFHTVMRGADGTVVQWSGYAEGYRPGERAEVELGLANGTAQVWNGRYCIHLLDERALVDALVQEAFALERGGAMSRPAVFHLPNSMPPGAYGLALVVDEPSGPIVNTVTIKVGDTAETFTVQQSAIDAALQACPPGE